MERNSYPTDLTDEQWRRDELGVDADRLNASAAQQEIRFARAAAKLPDMNDPQDTPLRGRWFQVSLGRMILSIGLLAAAAAGIRLAFFDIEARPWQVGVLATFSSVIAIAESAGVLLRREVAAAWLGCGACVLLIAGWLFYVVNYAVF